MRSLQLFAVLFFLLLVNPVKAVESSLLPADYYAVKLPFDEPAVTAPQNQTLARRALQEQVTMKAQQAMTLLLRRLTGNERLLESKLGRNYVNQAQNWLANYNLAPRYEDGVAIGKDIIFNFDAKSLNREFNARNIKTWPAQQRQTTLVMGSYVQRGSLQKLTDETLNYRIDIDFRNYPQSLRLPLKVAESGGKWVFPVDPEQTRLAIQELLIANNLKHLLSFKLAVMQNQQYQLDWYLFSVTGAVLQKNSISGPDRQELMQWMFNEVMSVYVKQNSIKLVKKNHILLKVAGLPDGNAVALLERELQAQQPMIRQAMLVTMDKTGAEFDIEYQGEVENLLNWLNSWPRLNAISTLQEQRLNAQYVHVTVPLEQPMEGER